MKVILSKEVPKLGHAGDIKDVSDGFARNFLLARGLAKPATPTNIQVHQKALTETAIREKKEKSAYEELARKLQSIELIFKIKVGEKGRPFGSITAEDIAEKLAESGKKIDKRRGD